MTRKYLLVCDERGTKDLTSKSRTFTIGGFVTDSSKIQKIEDVWSKIKSNLCGNANVELKWMHIFPGYHQEKTINPLLVKKQSEWRHLALWALVELFEKAEIFPITTIVQKDRVPESVLTTSKKGNSIISVFQMMGGTIGQFSRYIKEHKGKEGEIWFDKLGSLQEEERLQNQIFELFDNLALPSKENQKIVKRINPKLKFLDSEQEPIMQIADFVSGTIWASAEGDNWFFNKLLENYAPGKKRTYGILLLES